MAHPHDDTRAPDPAADARAWQAWRGRSETRHDRITAAPLAALAATLDDADPPPRDGDAAPPLAHWLFFWPLARASELGADGHARRGGFLPPVPLPRRMWAGGRLAFHEPLRVGDAVERVSRIQSVEAKRGRSGELVFVTVRHTLTGPRGLAVEEDHDIVYRALPAPGAPPAATAKPEQSAQYRRIVVPDAVLLFRYSALTFNGHRIHYDRRHCTEAEGYPGLVVHGPLIATLLTRLLREQHPGRTLRRFTFQALAPAFDDAPLALCGRDEPGGVHRLWTEDASGTMTMRAEAHTA